jgi:hypothetical protein
MRLYIGIDPDVDKSGFAVWDVDDQKFRELKTLEFWAMIEEIKLLNSHIACIVIEAGWLIKKSNWHPAQGINQREKIAKNVGMNHQVGKLIHEYCQRYYMTYLLVEPIGKINASTFKSVTCWKETTNQEQRDAGMLVFGRK